MIVFSLELIKTSKKKPQKCRKLFREKRLQILSDQVIAQSLFNEIAAFLDFVLERPKNWKNNG